MLQIWKTNVKYLREKNTVGLKCLNNSHLWYLMQLYLSISVGNWSYLGRAWKASNIPVNNAHNTSPVFICSTHQYNNSSTYRRNTYMIVIPQHTKWSYQSDLRSLQTASALTTLSLPILGQALRDHNKY